MAHSPESIVDTWLSGIGIHVSKQLLKEQVVSHPEYPSLLSITDALDYFNIGYEAARIEKDRLHEVATPFLAHLRSNRGEFVIVKNRDTIEKNHPGFFDHWSGITLSVEKSPGWKHAINEQWLEKEKSSKQKKILTGMVIAALSVAAIVFSPGWVVPVLLVIACSGIFISWLIVSKELGMENKIAEQVCGKKDDCGAVIHSEKAKLPLGIAWGDVGAAWFLSLLATVAFSSYAGNYPAVLALLSIVSAIAIPFTFFSLYYQWKVIRKWCRLCLITVGLLWAQSGVLVPNLFDNAWQLVGLKELLFFASIATMVCLSWAYVKKIIVKKNQFESKSFEKIRFQRQEAVVKALFAGQKKADTTPWENDLQLGNEAAPFQIMVGCNLYCGPCGTAHEKLDSLLEQYGDKIGIRVRFIVSPNAIADKRTDALRHILRHIENVCAEMNAADKAAYTREVVHQWFKIMDAEKFFALYPVTEKINVDDILLQHETWMADSKIAFTPTIFINGKQMPSLYTTDDIAWMILPGPEIFSEQEAELVSV